jgi:hypothetical protein
MTVVNIDLTDPDGTPLAGSLDWTPTARFVVGAELRLPTPVRVVLVAGVAAPDLPPSEPGWLWHVVERTNGGKTRYVQIPATGPVDYASLPDVDPATDQAAAPPSPAWVGDLASVTDSVTALQQTTTGLSTSLAAKADESTVATLTAQVAALPVVGYDADGTPYLSS